MCCWLVFPPSGNAFMPSCFPHLRDGAGLWVQFIDTEKVKNPKPLSHRVPASSPPVAGCSAFRTDSKLCMESQCLDPVSLIPSLCCVPHCSRSECLVCMGSCSHAPGLASPSWNVLFHLFSPDLLFISFTWLIPTHPWKLEFCLLRKPS